MDFSVKFVTHACLMYWARNWAWQDMPTTTVEYWLVENEIPQQPVKMQSSFPMCQCQYGSKGFFKARIQYPAQNGVPPY